MNIEITMPDGTVYATMREACEKEKVTYATVKRYMAEFGVSFADALDMIRKNGKRGKCEKISVVGPDGTEYPSIAEGCKAENVNYGSTIDRLRAGMTFAQAVEDIRASSASRKISWNGKTYETRSALCRDLGLPYGRLKSYLRQGLPLDDAIKATLAGNAYEAKKPDGEKIKTRRPVTLDGKTYPSVMSACEAFGIERHRITRLTREGLSIEKAFERAKEEEARKRYAKPIVDHKGRKFKSLGEFARAYGVKNCNLAQIALDRPLTLDDMSDYMARRIRHGIRSDVAGFKIIERVSGPYFKTLDADEHEYVMHIDELYDRHFAEIGLAGKEEAV